MTIKLCEFHNNLKTLNLILKLFLTEFNLNLNSPIMSKLYKTLILNPL
jgi:hypothetical protein